MCALLPEHEPDFDMVLCSLSKLSLFIVLLKFIICSEVLFVFQMFTSSCVLGITLDNKLKASGPVMVKAFINSSIFLAQFQGCAKYTLQLLCT